MANQVYDWVVSSEDEACVDEVLALESDDGLSSVASHQNIQREHFLYRAARSVKDVAKKVAAPVATVLKPGLALANSGKSYALSSLVPAVAPGIILGGAFWGILKLSDQAVRRQISDGSIEERMQGIDALVNLGRKQDLLFLRSVCQDLSQSYEVRRHAQEALEWSNQQGFRPIVKPSYRAPELVSDVAAFEEKIAGLFDGKVVGSRVVDGERQAFTRETMLVNLYERLMRMDFDGEPIELPDDFSMPTGMELIRAIRERVALLRDNGIVPTIAVDVDGTIADNGLFTYYNFNTMLLSYVGAKKIAALGLDPEEYKVAALSEYVSHSSRDFNVKNKVTGEVIAVVIPDAVKKIFDKYDTVFMWINMAYMVTIPVALSGDVAGAAVVSAESIREHLQAIGIEYDSSTVVGDLNYFSLSTMLVGMGIPKNETNAWLHDEFEDHHMNTFFEGEHKLNYPAIEPGIDMTRLFQYLGIRTIYVTTRSEDKDQLPVDEYGGQTATPLWIQGQDAWNEEAVVLLKPGKESDWRYEAAIRGGNEPGKTVFIKVYQGTNPGVVLVGVLEDSGDQIVKYLREDGRLLVFKMDGQLAKAPMAEAVPEGENVFELERRALEN